LRVTIRVEGNCQLTIRRITIRIRHANHKRLIKRLLINPIDNLITIHPEAIAFKTAMVRQLDLGNVGQCGRDLGHDAIGEGGCSAFGHQIAIGIGAVNYPIDIISCVSTLVHGLDIDLEFSADNRGREVEIDNRIAFNPLTVGPQTLLTGVHGYTRSRINHHDHSLTIRNGGIGFVNAACVGDHQVILIPTNGSGE